MTDDCSSSSRSCSSSLDYDSGDAASTFETYKKYVGQNLTDNISCGGAYVSHIKDMSLSEFQVARKLYCQHQHVPSLPLKCDTCLPLINAAKEVECQQIVKLRTLFCNHFKSSSYKTDKAIRRLMQLPVVVLKVKGTLYVLEYATQTDYHKLTQVIENLIPCEKMSLGLDRESLKALCDLASSEADRKLVKAAASASLSGVQAKAAFGISNVHELRKEFQKLSKNTIP